MKIWNFINFGKTIESAFIKKKKKERENGGKKK